MTTKNYKNPHENKKLNSAGFFDGNIINEEYKLSIVKIFDST